MEQQDVENISEDITVGFQRFLCNILLRQLYHRPLLPAILIIQNLNWLFNNLERIAAAMDREVQQSAREGEAPRTAHEQGTRAHRGAELSRTAHEMNRSLCLIR